MAVEAAIRKRVEVLIQESDVLQRTDQNEQAESDEQIAACHAWITTVRHLIALATGGPNSTYSKSIDRDYRKEGWNIPRSITELVGTLRHLLSDMDAGLFGSITDQARAETFDNFLDHAQSYHNEGRSQESGVIAGVVFEDSVRRVCRKHSIDEKGVQLDTLINSLVKAGVLTDIKAKRARTAAAVRTSATHARWEEFDLKDVDTTITFTRELIERELGG